ncbi:MAG: Hsp20/alpha crystallin family protein [Bacteroidota bacterium]
MTLIRWNPVRGLSAFPSDVMNLQKEIDRMFDSFFRTGLRDEEGSFPSAWTPAADIAEQDDAYIVTMELPGVSKDEVKVTLKDDVLSIHGEKKQEKEEKEKNYRRLERSYGMFERSFALGSAVRGDGIEASFKDGILTITVPKSDDAKVKQIEVKVR